MVKIVVIAQLADDVVGNLGVIIRYQDTECAEALLVAITFRQHLAGGAVRHDLFGFQVRIALGQGHAEQGALVQALGLDLTPMQLGDGTAEVQSYACAHDA